MTHAHILPGPIALIKETWELFVKRLPVLVGVSVGGFLPSLFFLMGLYTNVISLDTLWVFGAFILVSSLFSGVAWIAMIHVLHNSKISAPEAFQKALSTLGSFLWLVLLMGAVYFGSAIPFVFPALIVAVWLMFAPVVFAVEGKTGLAALLTSREYARGHWWAIVWRMIVLSFCSGVVLMILSLVFGAMAGGAAVSDQNFRQTGSLDAAAVIGLTDVLMQALTQILITPFSAAFLYVLYRHLKQIRGTFELSPSSKTRTAMIGFSLIGVPLLLAYFAAMIFLFSFFPRLSEQSERAMGRVSITQIRTALELYKVDNDQYPEKLSELEPYIASTVKLFTDPTTGLEYRYEVMSDGQGYQFCRYTEDTKGREVGVKDLAEQKCLTDQDSFETNLF